MTCEKPVHSAENFITLSRKQNKENHRQVNISFIYPEILINIDMNAWQSANKIN
jgi:hypothetical protein